MTEPTPLPRDYTLEEVAAAVRMSPRWVRDRIKHDKAEHTRRGHKILFTAEQVEKLRAAHIKAPVVDLPITTGKKKAS